MKSESKPSSSRPVQPNFSDETAPRTGSASVPVIIFLLFSVLLYGGTLYMDKYAGGFNPLVISPNIKPPEREGDDTIAKAKAIYSANCAPCHQASGMGMAGQFPPLAGSEWVVAPGANRIIRIVLNGASGPIQVKGAEFNGVMVPWRDSLKDEDIAAVVTYIRNEWGNKGSAVTVEQVKKIRTETADKSDAWIAEDLLKIPESD